MKIETLNGMYEILRKIDWNRPYSLFKAVMLTYHKGKSTGYYTLSSAWKFVKSYLAPVYVNLSDVMNSMELLREDIYGSTSGHYVGD